MHQSIQNEYSCMQVFWLLSYIKFPACLILGSFRGVWGVWPCHGQCCSYIPALTQERLGESWSRPRSDFSITAPRILLLGRVSSASAQLLLCLSPTEVMKGRALVLSILSAIDVVTFVAPHNLFCLYATSGCQRTGPLPGKMNLY